jgi:hypothetical protein
MGFFDKVKHFVGGHGCKVELTEVERQVPGHVQFPQTDSVIKGRYRITAERDINVVAHIHRFSMRIPMPGGGNTTVTLSESRHDASSDIVGCPLRWPYDLKAGQSVEDSFLISDIDVSAALQRQGNPPGVQFLVIVEADVKGTPVDAQAECLVTLT